MTQRTTAPAPRHLSGRAVVLGLIVAALLLSYAYPVRVYLAQQAELAHMQAEQQAQKQRIVALSQQRDKLDDPTYIRTEARRRFQMALPGEVLYVFYNDPTTGAPAPGTPPASIPTGPAARTTGPWYAQLWSSINTADRPEAR